MSRSHSQCLGRLIPVFMHGSGCSNAQCISQVKYKRRSTFSITALHKNIYKKKMFTIDVKLLVNYTFTKRMAVNLWT